MAARRELAEEVMIENPRFIRRIDPIRFRDKRVVWCVHPFLVEVKDPEIKTDWEHDCYRWITPREVSDYRTVPGLRQVIDKLLGA